MRCKQNLCKKCDVFGTITNVIVLHPKAIPESSNGGRRHTEPVRDIWRETGNGGSRVEDVSSSNARVSMRLERMGSL